MMLFVAHSLYFAVLPMLKMTHEEKVQLQQLWCDDGMRMPVLLFEGR